MINERSAQTMPTKVSSQPNNRVQRRRELARTLGLCATCCARRPPAGKATCGPCRDAASLRVRRARVREQDRRRSITLGRDYEAAGDLAVEQYAYSDAASHFERATAQSQTTTDKARLCEKVAFALFYGPRPERARPWLERAFDIYAKHDETVPEASRILLRLARQSWLESETVQGLGRIREARNLAGATNDRKVVARANLAIAHYLVLLGRYDEAQQHLRTLRISPLESPETRAILFNQRAIVRAAQGDARAAYADFEVALRAAREISDGYLVTAIWDDYANWATALGDIASARVCRERALLVARERQIAWRVPYLTLRYASLLIVLGEYARAREFVADAMTYDVDTPTLRVLLSIVGTELGLAVSDGALLEKVVDKDVLELAFASGEPARIGPIAAAFGKVYARRRMSSPLRTITSRAVRALESADHAGDILASSAAWGTPPDAERARKILQRRAKAPSGKVAAAFLEAWKLLAARRRLGTRMVIEQARTAAKAFADLGWHHQSAFVAGVSRVQLPAAAATSPGTERDILGDLQPSLTPRERQVAELVLRGYTNRAIATVLSITEHTVESHLSSIFNRLGLRSRWQLMDRVREEHSPG
ncbi:MAG TPA: LuxR C-terminal-related transcriptional regulator [Candidatus Baltobacteraceae bacterium]